VLLAPAARDLRALGLYLALSGAATVLLGRVALSLVDRAARLGIRGKIFVAVAIGNSVGLANVFVIAKLMFLSNIHDLRLLVALLVFSGVLTIFFALWIASSTTSRVQAIAAGIRSLSGGAYDLHVNVSGGDEMADLAQRMNDMAARLRAAHEQRTALDRQRRELTAGISHDLRTPLASLRAMVDALDDGIVDDPTEVARYHATMRREIERLMRMIEDLLELARLDAGALRLNRQPIGPQEIAAEVMDSMQPQADRLGVRLSLRVPHQLPVMTLDAERIERALGNLVRNALEHTPAGGSIEMSLEPNAGWLEVCVSDSGEGIAAQELPNIWDRFYRAEPSRSRGLGRADGVGLGLAIVRGIVEAHGGCVGATSVPGDGTTFRLRLPVGAPSASTVVRPDCS